MHDFVCTVATVANLVRFPIVKKLMSNKEINPGASNRTSKNFQHYVMLRGHYFFWKLEEKTQPNLKKKSDHVLFFPHLVISL